MKPKKSQFSRKELLYLRMGPAARKRGFSENYRNKLRFSIREKVKEMTTDLSFALNKLPSQELDQVFPPNGVMEEDDITALYMSIRLNYPERCKLVAERKRKLKKERRAMAKEAKRLSMLTINYLVPPVHEYPCPKCEREGTPYESESEKWFWIHDTVESEKTIEYCYIGRKPRGIEKMATIIRDKDKFLQQFQAIVEDSNRMHERLRDALGNST